MDVILLENSNYGRALREGIECGTRFVHIVNIEQWDYVFAAYCWANKSNFDLFLGSKRAEPLINNQNWYRKFLSWGLNATLSLLFETVAIDTHGPKFLDVKALSQIIRNTVMTRGQFDTEVSIKAIRAGLRVCEAPTEYIDKDASRFMVTKIFRNIYDIYFLREIKHPQNCLLRFRVQIGGKNSCSKKVRKKWKALNLNA